MSRKFRHTGCSDEEDAIREAALDETIAASFPASDPASSLPNPKERDAEGLSPPPGRVAVPRVRPTG